MTLAVIQLLLVLALLFQPLLWAWKARVWEWLAFLGAMAALAVAGAAANRMWPGALAGGLLLCTGPLADESLRRYGRAMSDDDFAGMLRWARVTAILRPFAESRVLPARVPINEHTHYRRYGAAIELLKPYEPRSFMRYNWFMFQLYRRQQRWLDLRTACERVFNSTELITLPGTYATYLQTFGEVNDHAGLIRNFLAYLSPIEQLEKDFRDYCFMLLFVFTGQPDRIQSLESGLRQLLGDDDYAYWLATAHHIAGEDAAAEELWAPMRLVGDEVWRDELARRPERLARFDRAALSEEARRLLEDVERRWVAVPALAAPR
ncbi:MAG TPA: hypothetical protein VGE07_23240 [Herpetosiphonaceae bacterium]